MNETKKKAEHFFQLLSETIIRFRWLTLAVALLICGLLASQVRHLTIDTSNEGFLHENDPILITYNEFRDQFGRDDMLAIAIHSDEIFTKAFLSKLKKLHEEIVDTVPHVNDITSMVNGRNTTGQGDTLLVDDLLANFPKTDEELARLKQRVMTNPLYKNQLISEDGTFTSIVIESDVYTGSMDDDLLSGFDEQLPAAESNSDASGQYLSDRENSEFVDAVRQVVKKYDGDDFHIYMAGSPVVMHTIKQFMMKDMQRFMRLALLTIGICLFIMFRRISGIFLPLLVVALSLISTLGIMAITGTSFKIPITILPSFLLAVGVGASVHVLSLTYQKMREKQAKNQAIIWAFSHSGLAIVMTSLTTAAGLASFSMAKVAPIADLGFFSAVGVVLALFYTLTILPSLLSILPIKHKEKQHETRANRMDRLLDRLTDFSVDRYKVVLSVAACVIILGLIGVSRVYFSHNPLKWLPEDLDVRRSTEMIDSKLKGSVVLEIILDTGRENGLYDRQTLQTMDRVITELENDYLNDKLFIGKTISVITILKEIHQALHANDDKFYRIPENEKLIPQEFLLFENSGSDDLQNSVDSLFRMARITVKVPWLDALLYVPFIRDVQKRFNNGFVTKKPKDTQEMRVTVTGIMSLFGRIIHAAIYSAAQSYGIALVIITFMMILLIGEWRLGLISMIPNLGPIFIVLGFMGWIGLPLDMFTMLIASIAIGIAVDDTIHFMYHFKRYYKQFGDVKEAVNRTLHTAGRAMLTTSIVLTIGFFIFMFASMNNLFYFGLLVGIAIILALGADLLLAPALMALMLQKQQATTQTFKQE